ncbi:YtxH domain-containing protein [Streptacidiphilus sp. 4-A2]|nr:YtxH domain-containing protein [Streptacidiphilus sp. 4-A2]
MRKLTFLAGLALGYVLGTRAGRERYEQLRKTARDLAQTPAVQSATRSAKQAAGTAAGRAADTVAGKVGDRLPSSVTDRVPYLRERSGTASADGWGSSAR